MRVIITGAAGQIGKEMVEELSGAHELCLIDRRPVLGRNSVTANLAQAGVIRDWRRWFRPQFRQWADLFAGADVVLHLAADTRPKTVLRSNIQATWNVLQAAVRHGVRRAVFASSNWAVKAQEMALAPACYLPEGPKIGSDAPPRPITLYGVSKALGELTGRMYIDERQLRSFIAVRIGSYSLTPSMNNEEVRHRWLGVHDLRSLLRCCVEREFDGFHVVYGVSAQPTSPYDLSYTRSLLSWEPRQMP